MVGGGGLFVNVTRIALRPVSERGLRLREIGRAGFDLDLVGAGLKYDLLPEQEGADADLFRAEDGVGPMP